MKKLLIPCFILSLFGLAIAGQTESPADKTLSPYFFVKSDDPSVDQLPLKGTSAEVDIAGVIARVKVTQVYKNEGQRPLEAIYIFPGSTRAAVHGMKMTIGERTITAKIEKRADARQQYEDAKQAGKTASLLEQQRPNVFQMNVANILPGDEIKVELVYTELLVPENGIYEFVYPTVVGPRYSETPAAGAPDTEKWVKSPYLREGEKPPYTFDIKAHIASGIALKEVASPSHEVKINFLDKEEAEIKLAETEESGGNRDFVLRYRLAEDKIETGLLLYEGKEENFFLCMIEPPRRFTSASIPPREYIFIVDVSGSMHGFPLNTSKEVMKHIINALRPQDYFNILFFSGGSYVLSPQSLEATQGNKTHALRELERQRGGGGTRLLPALQQAFSLPWARQDISRVIVIVTDGYISVERETFELIRENLNQANLFAFGIGSSVNRHLIEGMARVGKGSPFVVLDPNEAPKTAERFRKYVESPLLTGIDVNFEGFAGYDMEPAKVPDLFAQRPIVLTGKYRGKARGKITFGGYTGEGKFQRSLKVSKEKVSNQNEALKYLWARERVAILSDYASVDAQQTNKEEITSIGLKYNLLTEYTSFIAIDQRIRRQDGKVETVKQPLPLPRGVSDYAVGKDAAKAPRYKTAAPASMPLPKPALALKSGKGVPREESEVDALQPPAKVQVDIKEQKLVMKEDVGEKELKTTLAKLLVDVDSCFADYGQKGTVRIKVHFDGKGRIDRVEILNEKKWKDTPAFVSCLKINLMRSLNLPWEAGGHLVFTITTRSVK